MESYLFSTLKEKYGWNYSPTRNKMIDFALARGVKLQECPNSKRFYIIDDSIANYQWTTCSILPKYEVCKEGFIRNKQNKRLWTAIHNGYVWVRDYETKKHYLGHRMIMETFNPIKNSQDYIVDHINGIKTDNQLDNLRWVSAKGNQMAKIENWDKMAQPFQELLQLAGYKTMIAIFEENIKKFKKK